MKATVKIQLLLGILGLIGVFLVILSTSRYGIGISPDSVHYISTARSILSGNGYLTFDGKPFVSWPPLLPMLLAIPGLIGIDPLSGARLMNAVIFGLVIVLSGQLFLKHIKSKALVILASLTILLSTPLLNVSIMAWSEPFFVLSATLFILCLPSFLARKTFVLFFLVSIIAALSCLQRYIGITLIFTGFVLMASLMRSISLPERLKYAIGFSLVAGTPLSIWIIRNYIRTATLTGVCLPPVYTLSRNIYSMFDVLTVWFVPNRIPIEIRLLGIGIILVLTIVTVLASYYKGNKKVVVKELLGFISLPSASFVVIYILLVLLIASLMSVELESYRLFSPIYIFVMCVAFIVAEKVMVLINRISGGKRFGNIVVIGACMVWLIYPVGKLVKDVPIYIRTGAGGYNTIMWKESRLIEWLKCSELSGDVYSNGPDAIYILSGVRAEMIPNRGMSISKVAEYRQQEEKRYVVWFNNVRRNDLYDIREVVSMLKLERVNTFADGGIYLVK